MVGWIDLHTHILPAVDDGARSEEESLQMAQLAVQSGVQVLAATPHSCGFGKFDPAFAQAVQSKTKQFQQMLDDRGIRLLVLPGMEILADDGIGELLKSGRLLPLGNSRCALVEFRFHEDPSRTFFLLEEVLSAGFRPLIAHPERYPFLQREPELAEDWRRMGCLLQVNKGSLLGRFGTEPRLCARRLLAEGLADAVASDAHTATFRTTDLRAVYEWITEQGGKDTARRLMQTNPLAILRGGPTVPVRIPWDDPRF